jgi:hypothetical protein
MLLIQYEHQHIYAEYNQIMMFVYAMKINEWRVPEMTFKYIGLIGQKEPFIQ